MAILGHFQLFSENPVGPGSVPVSDSTRTGRFRYDPMQPGSGSGTGDSRVGRVCRPVKPDARIRAFLAFRDGAPYVPTNAHFEPGQFPYSASAGSGTQKTTKNYQNPPIFQFCRICNSPLLTRRCHYQSVTYQPKSRLRKSLLPCAHNDTH